MKKIKVYWENFKQNFKLNKEKSNSYKDNSVKGFRQKYKSSLDRAKAVFGALVVSVNIGAATLALTGAASADSVVPQFTDTVDDPENDLDANEEQPVKEDNYKENENYKEYKNLLNNGTCAPIQSEFYNGVIDLLSNYNIDFAYPNMELVDVSDIYWLY